MKILAIESSCDETAAAIIEDGSKILSNVVVSQVDIFAAYGGVIPEVAARSHLEAILPVIHQALIAAGVAKYSAHFLEQDPSLKAKLPENADPTSDIDAIAVTHTPGLMGSLMIGTLTARMLAILWHKPLYAVHHLKSHVYANWLQIPSAPQFPLLALVISGGHTQILYMPSHNHFEIIGTTRDDAIGECFDKVAKILGLPYPGGPAIARCAQSGNPTKYHLPHPKVDGLDFSFSGLKTAVLRAVQSACHLPISTPSHELKHHLTPEMQADFAASFQNTACDILLEKLRIALKAHPEAHSVIFAGGVSANQLLREKAQNKLLNTPEAQNNHNQHTKSASEASKTPKISKTSVNFPNPAKSSPVLYFPDPQFTGDNAAMVGAAAYFEIQSGVQPTDPYQLDIAPRTSLS